MANVLANGLASHQAGDLSKAERFYRKAISLQPGNPEAVYLYGMLLFQQGRFVQAVDQFSRALELAPGEFELRQQLANALREAGQLDAALLHYDALLAANPSNIPLINNKGVTLTRLARFREAVECLQLGVTLAPDVPELHCNLGVALHQLDCLADAQQAYGRAIALNPGYLMARKNLATVFRDQGLLDASLAEYRQLLAMAPDYPDAHFGLAFSLLLNGDLAPGWLEYEWRWQSSNSPETARRFTRPQWSGQALEGRTVWLYSEQGAGDAIQFARYIPLLAAQGARVILECPAALQPLFVGLEGVNELVGCGAKLKHYDYHCALMSLPNAYGTTLATIPAYDRYPGWADDAFILRLRLSAPSHGVLRVGVVWSGSALHINNARRSCPLELILTLASVPSIELYGLQKPNDPMVSPLGSEGGPVHDLGGRLNDFADTAAVIDQLDLVIGVDTAVAHLAGALGKAVWVLLPFAPDWRWLLHRSDSPWYPSMRLFRQARPGDWAGVISDVMQSLRELQQDIKVGSHV